MAKSLKSFTEVTEVKRLIRKDVESAALLEAARAQKVRKVGLRVVKRREDERVIGRYREWILIELTSLSKHPWRTLRLYRGRIGRKNVFCLGGSAERMARVRDQFVLEEHYPAIAEWVRSIVVKQEA